MSLWKTVQICLRCWMYANPGRQPVLITDDVRETTKCFDCGGATRSGIYVRRMSD